MPNSDARHYDSMTTLACRPRDDLVRSPSSIQNSDPWSSSYHRSKPSASLSTSRSRRSLTTLARERSSAALASLAAIGNSSSTTLRSVNSASSLACEATRVQPARPTITRAPASSPAAQQTLAQKRTGTATVEISTRLAAKDTMTTSPSSPAKTHQTSSKMLRMADDNRPFSKDLKDLFSTLMTSLPLTPHRVRFTRVDETFSSEEAIANLGSLKFSQSNRVPDPKNPSRWVITTTTTTFSMAKEMAHSVCQRFVDARLIESAESKNITTFALKGAIWQMTAKGVVILQRFCLRNGVVAKHIEPIIRRGLMEIVVLERQTDTDKMTQDRNTIEIIFRRFMGQDGPNLKSSASISDSDSVSDYSSGLVGVKMAKTRRIDDKTFTNTFTGKAASDWLLDCCSTVDRGETCQIAELFVEFQLIQPVTEDRNYIRINQSSPLFQPTKAAIYSVTDRGQRLCGWLGRPQSVGSENSQEVKEKTRTVKDSNISRMNAIIEDAALRLLFKEYLRTSRCEENLQFYLNVSEFTEAYRSLDEKGTMDRPGNVRETLAAAYGLYNSFLAAGAPSELNLDHSLRTRLDRRMIRADNDEQSLRESLDEIVVLFELAQSAVFKLMASDSVPKFLRDPRYVWVLRDHDLDLGGATRPFSPSPKTSSQQSISRSNTLHQS